MTGNKNQNKTKKNEWMEEGMISVLFKQQWERSWSDQRVGGGQGKMGFPRGSITVQRYLMYEIIKLKKMKEVVVTKGISELIFGSALIYMR